nr:PREDICTED: signal-transducing adaptor protein 2 [Latimeria chalumnae]|eukprot:XP_014345748.1 PREDICTED: signal-transducing adaptor protein 2 [Latimeria chalumnae]
MMPQIVAALDIINHYRKKHTLQAVQTDFKKYWAVLRENTIYFYNNSRDTVYVEKLELEDFVSIQDDNSKDKDLNSAKLTLKLKSRDVKIKLPSLEDRELWKGFIKTVVQLEVPTDLILLPGHLLRMSEVAKEEKERRSQTYSDYVDVQNDKPRCYYTVSRHEAEYLLESNPQCGNFLLRPGGHTDWISVTTRQVMSGQPLVKHYKVHYVDNRYIIEVSNPVYCRSLHEVADYFINVSKRALVPFVQDQDYEDIITFVSPDIESGETTTHVIPKPEMLTYPQKPGTRVA